MTNLDITLKLTDDKGQIVSVEQIKTNAKGEFTHTFKVPEATEAGIYTLKVQANEPVNKVVELKLVIVEEQKPKVNKKTLGEKIAEVEDLKKEDYTGETWKELQTALVEAEEVVAKEDATQEEVDKVLKKLTDAIKELKSGGEEVPSEEKPEVKVTFNHTECTVQEGDYVPESGDLIVTTTGLKDEEIKSVTIKSSKENIVEVTQRPDYPEGGYPKSKTRAFGKAKKLGNCSIIAIVTDVYGNEYTAECKVIVKEKEQKIDVKLHYYDSCCGLIGFTIKPITELPDKAYYRWR